MNKTLIACLMIVLAVGVWSCETKSKVVAGQEDDKNSIMSDEDKKVSYALGMEIGAWLKQSGANIKMNAFRMGVEAAMSGGETIMTTEEANAAKQEYFQKLQDEKATKNMEAGKKFLEENKSKEGVKITASGLQYKVVEEGTGAKPAATDKVTVHYTGTLIDGTKFDSSVDRGQPATFGLNQVIRGWTEGLQLMSVGSKYRFFIPSDLGYGEQAPPSIGPNSVLIFDVELIGIGEPAAAPKGNMGGN